MGVGHSSVNWAKVELLPRWLRPLSLSDCCSPGGARHCSMTSGTFTYFLHSPPSPACLPAATG